MTGDEDDRIRQRLRARGCARHVVDGGWPGLVRGWRKVVGRVKEGRPSMLEEHLNDMDLREIIESVLPLVDEAERQQVRRLDEELRPHLRPTDACIWGDSLAVKNGWTRERNWWYFALPRIGVE